MACVRNRDSTTKKRLQSATATATVDWCEFDDTSRNEAEIEATEGIIDEGSLGNLGKVHLVQHICTYKRPLARACKQRHGRGLIVPSGMMNDVSVRIRKKIRNAPSHDEST